jgi:hypothetical protein
MYTHIETYTKTGNQLDSFFFVVHRDNRRTRNKIPSLSLSPAGNHLASILLFVGGGGLVSFLSRTDGK